MILEEATFEAFGYEMFELSYGSAKPIIAACELCGGFRVTSKLHYRTFCRSCSNLLGEKCKGKNHPMFGKTGEKSSFFGKKHTDKTKAKISAAQKGEKNHFYGKELTEDHKAKLSAAHKGIIFTEEHKANLSAAAIGREVTEETRTLMRIAAHKRMHNAKPYMTAPEITFQRICIDNNLPFKFVGDGLLWLGNANPDFIHTGKRKIAVEVFGDYWHSPLLRNNIRYNHTVEGRRKQLKAEGYKCIFIWESDLMRKDPDKFVVELIQKERII